MILLKDNLEIHISGDLNEYSVSCPGEDVTFLKQYFHNEIQAVIIDDMLKRADTVVFDMFKPSKRRA